MEATLRERQHGKGDRVEVAGGLAATGLEEVGLLSLSSADHSEIAEVTKQTPAALLENAVLEMHNRYVLRVR